MDQNSILACFDDLLGRVEPLAQRGKDLCIRWKTMDNGDLFELLHKFQFCLQLLPSVFDCLQELDGQLVVELLQPQQSFFSLDDFILFLEFL